MSEAKSIESLDRFSINNIMKTLKIENRLISEGDCNVCRLHHICKIYDKMVNGAPMRPIEYRFECEDFQDDGTWEETRRESEELSSENVESSRTAND